MIATGCSGIRRIVVYGENRLSNETMRRLSEEGYEVKVVPVGNITITGTCGTGMLFDELDRRIFFFSAPTPTEPKMAATQRTYGPQRKGKGGKIRRW